MAQVLLNRKGTRAKGHIVERNFIGRKESDFRTLWSQFEVVRFEFDQKVNVYLISMREIINGMGPHDGTVRHGFFMKLSQCALLYRFSIFQKPAG